MQYIKHREPDGPENKLVLPRLMQQTMQELNGFCKNETVFGGGKHCA
jgi:hypothetical protein